MCKVYWIEDEVAENVELVVIFRFYYLLLGFTILTIIFRFYIYQLSLSSWSQWLNL